MSDDLRLDEIEKKLLQLKMANERNKSLEGKESQIVDKPQEPVYGEYFDPIAYDKEISQEPKQEPLFAQEQEISPQLEHEAEHKPVFEPKNEPVFATKKESDLAPFEPEKSASHFSSKKEPIKEKEPSKEVAKEVKQPQETQQKDKSARRFPFFSSKEKAQTEPVEELKQEPSIQEKSANTFKKSQEPVQIIHRDRGVALSRFLEGIENNLKEINLKQDGQAVREDVGSAQNPLESVHINYVIRNISSLNPVVALNILCEISHRFKDGSSKSVEFLRLIERIFEMNADCDSLLKLDERIKLKPKKKQLIKKIATLLNRWKNSQDKKILDEIYALKSEAGMSIDDFSSIAASFAKGKDIFDDLKAFCGFKLGDVVEPFSIKDKPFAAPTLFELLDEIYRETVELKYDILSENFVASNATQRPANDPIDFQPILEEFRALSLQIKSLKDDIKAQKDEIKALNDFKRAHIAGASSPKRKTKKSKAVDVQETNAQQEPTYKELLEEISQLKSELQSEIKNINLDEQE